MPGDTIYGNGPTRTPLPEDIRIISSRDRPRDPADPPFIPKRVYEIEVVVSPETQSGVTQAVQDRLYSHHFAVLRGNDGWQENVVVPIDALQDRDAPFPAVIATDHIIPEGSRVVMCAMCIASVASTQCNLIIPPVVMFREWYSRGELSGTCGDEDCVDAYEEYVEEADMYAGEEPPETDLSGTDTDRAESEDEDEDEDEDEVRARARADEDPVVHV